MAKEKLKLPTKPLPDLLAWWRKAKVPGVIIGGLAIAYRGNPRTTRDVDAIIFLDDNRLVDFLEQGESFSFKPRIPDPIAFARESRVLLLRHGKSQIDIDLSLGGPMFEPQILERAQNVKVGKLTLPIATVEDLLVLKAVANRHIDRVDIAGLLEFNDDVDIGYVRRHLANFAALLEMPEILDDFEQMLGDRKAAISARTKSSRKKRQ